MKDWFKYEYGYVNFDDDNIYLTNSGNWSDTLALDEYQQKRKKKLPSKGLIFILIVGVLFACLMFMNLMSGKLSLLLLIGLPIGGLAVYNYMKTEIGDTYRIPLTKINSIKISDGTVTIDFIDADGQQAQIELKKVGPEGLEKVDAICYSIDRT